ncbi:MAG: hypothetical protein K1X53_16545 [Candidatus Sumerlaeaceae bacterium]|nr:hypothetical protein [Candidatus Sumerlaeaceae bacterium]
MWAKVPLEELVQGSDIIVVARLSKIQRQCDGTFDYCTGTLTIKETLWGNVQPGRKLLLSWTTALGWSTQIDHRGNEGHDMIWLLRRDTGREVHASYPWRVRDVRDRDEVLRIIREYPVCLQVPPTLPPDGHQRLDIVVRNATTSTLILPLIRGTPDTVATVGPQVRFHALNSSDITDECTSPPVTFHTRPTTETTALAPGREYRQRLRLDTLCGPAEPNRVYWEIEGLPPSNPPYVRSAPPDVTSWTVDPDMRAPLIRRVYNRWTVDKR